MTFNYDNTIASIDVTFNDTTPSTMFAGDATVLSVDHITYSPDITISNLESNGTLHYSINGGVDNAVTLDATTVFSLNNSLFTNTNETGTQYTVSYYEVDAAGNSIDASQIQFVYDNSLSFSGVIGSGYGDVTISQVMGTGIHAAQPAVGQNLQYGNYYTFDFKIVDQTASDIYFVSADAQFTEIVAGHTSGDVTTYQLGWEVSQDASGQYFAHGLIAQKSIDNSAYMAEVTLTMIDIAGNEVANSYIYDHALHNWTLVTAPG